jgi:DNA adenine methylase
MRARARAVGDDPPAAKSARAGRRRGLLPAPFLKWAGGKGQLLREILGRMPDPIAGTYVEPFLGGGAVFFELVRRGRIARARLADRNPDLIATYRAVRDDVEGVIAALARHRNDEEHYYEVRALEPDSLPLAERAARTIFLNRVGYNGLYRVNASGRFNVPFGRYRNPKICDPDGLRAASAALSLAEIEIADFEETCSGASAGDVVYLDPPYLPLSKTASFTAYSGGFGEEEHRRLSSTFARLVDAGAFALLSNSDTKLSRSLYAGFKIATVEATRAINSNPDRRGVVREVLVQGLRVPTRARAAR